MGVVIFELGANSVKRKKPLKLSSEGLSLFAGGGAKRYHSDLGAVKVMPKEAVLRGVHDGIPC